MHSVAGTRHRAFSAWLRTGRLPIQLASRELEFKFNPWHDPENGRFTFVGQGRYFGPGNARSGDGQGQGQDRPKINFVEDPDQPAIASVEDAEAWAAGQLAKYGDIPGYPEAIEGRLQLYKHAIAARSPDPLRQMADFASGAGEGLLDTATEAVAGVYALLTTNPLTTAANIGIGIAEAIDAAIEAENTPTYAHLTRAANSVANASAREIGHATGSVVGNAALAVTQGAALSKVSTLRGVRNARPRPTYDPPQVGWVKETLKSNEPWKIYNDSATGSRPGQAPTLMRTMPDGSRRPVKFDGIQGDFLIDRKWAVPDAPRARAQLLRQSEVLSQHRLIGVWEVPTSAQKIKAVKLLRKMNVTNIKVRVVKP